MESAPLPGLASVLKHGVWRKGFTASALPSICLVMLAEFGGGLLEFFRLLAMRSSFREWSSSSAVALFDN